MTKKLAENFEDSWRELFKYVSDKVKNKPHLEQTRKEKKRKIKERVKPLVRKEIQRLEEER